MNKPRKCSAVYGSKFHVIGVAAREAVELLQLKPSFGCSCNNLLHMLLIMPHGRGKDLHVHFIAQGDASLFLDIPIQVLTLMLTWVHNVNNWASYDGYS
ncbi:hypothetical protein Leryth_008029 [Lithospermum erythrorhizon]|nr:hypothetical protein Leryth_008029 [Lithospermum erythrorhizon]